MIDHGKAEGSRDFLYGGFLIHVFQAVSHSGAVLPHSLKPWLVSNPQQLSILGLSSAEVVGASHGAQLGVLVIWSFDTETAPQATKCSSTSPSYEVLTDGSQLPGIMSSSRSVLNMWELGRVGGGYIKGTGFIEVDASR